jgi:hypothetical protein
MNNNGGAPGIPTMMDAHARVQASLPYQRWRTFFETILQDVLEERMIEVAEQQSLEQHQQELFRNNHNDLWEVEETTCPYVELIKDKEDETGRCSICLENFEKEDMCTRLEECRHFFHTECLKTAIQHQHQQCPQCRGKIRLIPVKKEETAV